MSKVSIGRYIDYSRKSPGLHGGSDSNYGCHCMAVTLPGIQIFFSYVTPVAFCADLCHDGKLVMCENEWGPTTGRHMSAIRSGRFDEGVIILPRSVFGDALDAVLSQIFSKGAPKKVEVVEKRVEVERIRKIVVPKVYKTVCPSCQARDAKVAKAEKNERNIIL